jgi:succinate dehydrogenase/fumarate reductase-like Fe-S protein
MGEDRHIEPPWSFFQGSIRNRDGEVLFDGTFYRIVATSLILAAPDMHAALVAQAARDAHGRWNCTSCLCDDVDCSVAVELEAEAIRLREEALKKAKGE